MSEPIETPQEAGPDTFAPPEDSDRHLLENRAKFDHADDPAPAVTVLDHDTALDSATPLYADAPFRPLKPVQTRTPNFFDLTIFFALLAITFILVICVMGVALALHIFGLKGMADAQSDSRFLLGTQSLFYISALGICAPVFTIIWKQRFFAGIHWHPATVKRLWLRLFGVAIVCNLLAVIADMTMPFPQNAPIDKMFQTSMQAWLLFAFGVTAAPFFEEMIFRGFILPAAATTWDWIRERMSHNAAPPLDAEGNPVWSLGAMIFGSVVASVPFTLMHAGQVSRAWAPLSVLFCVSSVLCAVRLVTRSLAASTLVHATYNFMLFAVMMVQTGGFRHMDKL